MNDVQKDPFAPEDLEEDWFRQTRKMTPSIRPVPPSRGPRPQRPPRPEPLDDDPVESRWFR